MPTNPRQQDQQSEKLVLSVLPASFNSPERSPKDKNPKKEEKENKTSLRKLDSLIQSDSKEFGTEVVKVERESQVISPTPLDSYELSQIGYSNHAKILSQKVGVRPSPNTNRISLNSDLAVEANTTQESHKALRTKMMSPQSPYKITFINIPSNKT